MPTKNRKPGRKRQGPSPEQIQKNNAAQIERRNKERDRERAKRDREYSASLRKLEKVGVYKPKSHELTKYRRSRIRQSQREYSEFLNPRAFFFVPAGRQERKKAKAAEIKTTQDGFFFERGGYKRAQLKVSKKTGEAVVIRTGKVKKGTTGAGKKYTSKIPLSGLDQLNREKERMRETAASFGKMGKNERLYFVLSENGVEGFSRRTFDNIEHLMEYLMQYEKRVPWKVSLFRHVEIMKTDSATKYFRAHPPKHKGFGGKVNAKGRNV